MCGRQMSSDFLLPGEIKAKEELVVKDKQWVRII
jgi:hypothetical protein